MALHSFLQQKHSNRTESTYGDRMSLKGREWVALLLWNEDPYVCAAQCLTSGAVSESCVRGEFMKTILVAAALSLVTCFAYAAEVRDWKDLEKVHQHIQESIREMERARAANHYDMQGHGAKAEQLLREAQKELHEAVEVAKKH
jgi:hypothetical protein